MSTLNLAWTATLTGPVSVSFDATNTIPTGSNVTGKLDPATGKFTFLPTGPLAVPPPGTVVTATYQGSNSRTQNFTGAPITGGNMRLDLARAIKKGSVKISLQTSPVKPAAQAALSIDYYSEVARLFYNTLQVVECADVPGGGTTGTFNNGVVGTIDYTSGLIQITVASNIPLQVPVDTWRFNVAVGDDGTAPITRDVYDGLIWQTGATHASNFGGTNVLFLASTDTYLDRTETFPFNQVSLTIGDGTKTLLEGSIRFLFCTKTYIDRAGVLYHSVNPTTNAGTAAGTINYSTGVVSITDWISAQSAFTLLACGALSTEDSLPVSTITFRIPSIPIRTGSLQIRAADLTGTVSSVTAGTDGTISGGLVAAGSTVDYLTGLVRLAFTQPVLASSIKYNAVAIAYIPLSSDILGLDSVRLPVDGRVPIYRPGGVVVVHNTQSVTFAGTPAVGSSVNCGRVRLTSVRLLDSHVPPNTLATTMYTANLDSGIVTLSAGYSASGLTLPILAEHKVEDMALVSDVEISGRLALTRPLTHNYPANTSFVSSALLIGNIQARVFNLFSQTTWTGVWSDDLIGSQPPAQYNDAVNPIQVSNLGALNERWYIQFTNSTTYRLVGENVGQIAVGDITTNFSPMNPEQSVPYFTILAAGWGAGWSAGNVVRFNTAGANYPLWMARTVLQGPETVDADRFQVQIRGDINH